MIRVYTQKYIPGKAEQERVDDVPQFAIGRAINNVLENDGNNKILQNKEK